MITPCQRAHIRDNQDYMLSGMIGFSFQAPAQLVKHCMDASYPYLGDLLHAALGVDVALPLPMFGLFVALAVAIAASVFTQDARRAEAFGRLPVDAHQVAGDLTIITLFAGLVGARLFHVLDHWGGFLRDPGSLIITRGGFSIYGAFVLAHWLACCWFGGAGSRFTGVDAGVCDWAYRLPGVRRRRLGRSRGYDP